MIVLMFDWAVHRALAYSVPRFVQDVDLLGPAEGCDVCEHSDR